jgi:dienelactone hydrolase
MAAPLQPVEFSSKETVAGADITLTGWWTKTSRSGKHPAVIVLHGCGGLYSTRKGHESELTERHQAMAGLLNQAGYQVLLPDSFTARGVRSLCSSRIKERDITPDVRRQDVLAALHWLAQQPEVDASRIALLGWSNGGATTLDSMDASKADSPSPQLKAAVAFYPGCSPYQHASRYKLDKPLLILTGASDDWTPAAPCVALASRLQPAPIRTVVYPDSYHDFDAPNQPVHVRKDVPNGTHPGAGVTTGSNPVAREQAYQEMLSFLRQYLQ